MLILDRNNEPTSTVYYLSATIYECLCQSDGLDAASLYQQVTLEMIGREVSYEFFVMALDFLFLLDRVTVDEKGGLHVYQVTAHPQYCDKHSYA